MPLVVPQPRRPGRRRGAPAPKPTPRDPASQHSPFEAERIDFVASLATLLDDQIEVVEDPLTQSMLLDFALQPLIVPASSPATNTTGDASYVGEAQKGTGSNPARSDLGGLAENTYQLKMAVAAAFQIKPGSIGGRAYRPYKSDHTTGHAIDIPGAGDRGDLIAAWVVERASEYKVKYIIFNYRIWYPGRGWKPYNPSSAVKGFASDAGHVHHVHVSTY
jgi:hypothetical protein